MENQGNDEVDRYKAGDLVTHVPPPPPPRTDTFLEVDAVPKADLKTIGLAMKHRYKYRPFKDADKEIRLFMLRPQADENDNAINISIFTKPISEVRGNFFALSYYWGFKTGDDPKNPVRVEASRINMWDVVGMAQQADRGGKPKLKDDWFLVHNNLYLALKRLRPQSGSKDSLLLWVDFICINQGHDIAATVERNKQVARMAEIYNSAKNVIIWLGDGVAATNLAMDFILDIGDLNLLEKYLKPGPDALQKWAALSDLMRFRWFSRRWVVQEVALARSAIVWCGQKKVPWIAFSNAVSLFTKHLDKIRSLYQSPQVEQTSAFLRDAQALGAVVLVKTVANLARKSKDGELKERLESIESLVSSLISFSVSRPHDAIYSLVALARDTCTPANARPGRASQKPVFPLEIDYQQNEIQLFATFTRNCIETSKSVDIICRNWAPGVAGQRFPSWIRITWDSSFGTRGDTLPGRRSGDSFVGVPSRIKKPTYHASKDIMLDEGDIDLEIRTDETKPQPDNPNPNIEPLIQANPRYYLRVKGVRIGVIKKVFARVMGDIIDHEWLRELGRDPQTNEPTETLWKTLVADRDHNGDSPPPWYGRACGQCLSDLTITDVNGDFRTSEEDARSRKPHSSDMLEFLRRVTSIVKNRCLFKANPLCENCATTARPAAEREHSLDKCPYAPPGSRSKKDSPLNSDSDDVDSLDEAFPEGMEPELDSIYGLGPGQDPFKCKNLDLVCILKGCSVPVIVRKRKEGRYKLVGESFVYGHMDGEAIERLDDTYETWDFDDILLE